MRCSLYSHPIRLLCATLLAAALLCLQAQAEVSQEDLDRRAYEVYQQVFSPFCPGRSLNDCPSSKAHNLKLSIREKLELGVPAEVVLEQVLQQYGEQYRAVPRYAGFGKLVWLVPFAFLALGAVIALIIARGKTLRPSSGAQVAGGQEQNQPGDGGQPAKHVSEDLRRQIESELAQLD
ncbi:MAG: cytochrome c-type biogenesis protein CcmH [Pseudomonadota bacterium]|jgi:cytochrome c-type biogenesis protein CcmH/NrfF